MISFKCKMCGGDLHPVEGCTTVECEYCGTTQTIAGADNEKKANLFNRANHLRMASEFDRAAGMYESILADFPEEAEAYWGLCLCAYGIEYVDDPASGKKIPTCHRTQPESIMENANFEAACDYADSVARKLYREEAKAIDRLQKDILAIVAKEEPYDVFICYKETDDSGNRTVDSVLGQDIYDALTTKGMKVFFARITLEDKLGQQYEPYIYAALHSAKVMLALGTSFEHFDAVWVKNEWSRFIDMASKDKTKTLIPCYKDIDAYDIPKEFRNLQAQDMGKLGWMQDLVRGVEKICGKTDVRHMQQPHTETVVFQKIIPSELENTIKRGNLALENNQWNEAIRFYDKALNMDSACAEAYLGIACAKEKCASKEEFIEKWFYNKNSIEFTNARRFANAEMKKWIDASLKSIEEKGRYFESLRRKYLDRKHHISKRFIPALDGSPCGLKADGTVLAFRDEESLHCDVSGWENIVSVVRGYNIYGLKLDGTVVATGNNEFGQCDVSGWRDITALDLGRCGDNASEIVYGLKSDGTVVAAGNNDEGACNVGDWRNIVSIETAMGNVYGLKSDGTVVAAGGNKYGQCNVGDWRNIVSIETAMGGNVYGLKSDGTVVAAGDNFSGQCNVGDWRNIVSIETVMGNVYGLKSDGTVVAAGDNKYGQCNVGDWRNIVSIDCSWSRAYGLKSDGTVVAAGDNEYGQCNVGDWRNIISIKTSGGETYMA